MDYLHVQADNPWYNYYLMHASNNSADQPVYPRSLISDFGIRYLQSTIVQLAPRQESLFELVFVAEQAGLGHTCSEIPDSFFHVNAHNMVFFGP